MPYPRFTKAITQYFIIKDKSISVRNRLFMHTVQHDSILGSLKYVSKTDDYQAYGALILAEMTNLTMWNSPTYKTFLAYATGVITPKKARKLRNLLLHQRRKVLLLLKSLLRNLMLKDSQLVFKSETLLVLDKKVIKRSKRETNIHQEGSSSKGAGLEPEVPNEPKGKSIDINSDDNDDDDQQSDDEQTESNNPRTSDDEEETQEDEFVHTPENYVPTDDETNDVDDEEYRKINEEMYDDVNVELKDVELANEGKSNQVQNEAQVTTIAAPAQVASSSRSISSNYGSIFLNLDNISSVETGIISMLDVQVQHENLNIHSSSLLTVPVSVIPEPIILSSIPETLTTATTSNPAVQESETLSTIHLRISDLEKEVKELKNVDHSSALLATIKSEVLTAVKEYLGTSLDDALYKQESQYTITSSDKAALKEFDQKRNLFERMAKSKYLTEIPSTGLKPDDADQDKDPPARPDQGLKKKKTSAQAEETVFEAGDTQVPHNLGEDMGKTVDDGPTQKWLSDLAKAEKPAKTFDDLISTPINFSAFAMNRLHISDLTQAVLVGPVYKLLKGTCRSDRYPFNLSKPLPLVQSRNHQIVPVGYFFNNDLAYLQGGSTGRTYMTSLTKTKAAQYDLVSKHDVYSTKRILAVTNVKVNKCITYVHETNCNSEKSRRSSTWCRKLPEEAQHLKATNTHKVSITDLELYTTYFNPQGVIYLDKLERNRLMCSHELYKFSDGTLISVHDKLKNMVNNLEIGYTSVMPRRK
ncbi:hypothetical protein Tco_0337254 [Tanacetum coccineum]